MKLADAMIIFGGLCLAIAGFLTALLMAGVLLIADKPADPQRYLVEVGTAWAVLAGGLAVAALGGWLVRRGIRKARAQAA